MLPRHQLWLAVAALLGGLAVALGAFGAHGLESYLGSSGLADEGIARRLAQWETAVRYHMYHALALLAVSLLSARRAGLLLDLAGGAMTLGTLIFSGCLYALVLSGQTWLGAIVPIGGLLMIAGWGCLLLAALRRGEG